MVGGGGPRGGLGAAVAAARAALGPAAPVVAVSVGGGAGPGPGPGSGPRRVTMRGGGSGVWHCDGTAEEAVVAAVDPTAGLCARLGAPPALCLVGVAREPALGPDAAGSGAVHAARAAAVAGVPAVAACVPSRAPGAPLGPAETALAEVLRAAAGVLAEPGGGAPPPARNSPRAHFPFPALGRWSALGTAQLPVDAALAASLQGEPAGEGFAAADCWSLGGGVDAGGGAPPTAGELRGAVRQAFREGDAFLTVSVPPAWDGRARGRPFASTRPGVLWRQEPVSAAAGPPGGVPGGGAGAGGEAGSRDLFGRSLPRQTLGDAQPRGEGAAFVPQLATAALLRAGAGAGAGEGGNGGAPEGPWGAEGGAPAPGEAFEFDLGEGTLLHDASPRGDADAVLAGRAAVTLAQTWPPGHAFALLDAALAEALREGPGGMPDWLL